MKADLSIHYILFFYFSLLYMEMMYLIYNGVRYEDCGKLVIMRSGRKPPHMMKNDSIVDAITDYYTKGDGLIVIENRDNQESSDTAIIVWSHARKI